MWRSLAMHQTSADRDRRNAKLSGGVEPEGSFSGLRTAGESAVHEVGDDALRVGIAAGDVEGLRRGCRALPGTARLADVRTCGSMQWQRNTI